MKKPRLETHGGTFSPGDVVRPVRCRWFSWLLVALLACLSITPGEGAEAPPEVVHGQPCAIHLSSSMDLAIADDGGLCSFRPASESKPLRFMIVSGLADTNLVSFESLDRPGFFLRHFFFRLKLERKGERPDPILNADATFELRPVRTGEGLRLKSFNYRECYVAASHTRKAYIVPDPSPEAMVLTLVY